MTVSGSISILSIQRAFKSYLRSEKPKAMVGGGPLTVNSGVLLSHRWTAGMTRNGNTETCNYIRLNYHKF